MAVSPVVITGMHRSGTSLLASFLAASGVDLGDDLFPADAHNRHGYFEDRELLELQTVMLHACCPPGETGFLDWGWTWGERFDRSRLAEYRARAAEVAAARAAGGRTWGWKDPRTSLLLGFWDGLLPDLGADPRYVLAYRSPWEVMRSVARLPVAPLERRPDVGLRTWSFYNRPLLAFYRAHAERCLLFPIDVLVADPEAVLDALRAKLGLALPTLGSGRAVLASVVDPELLARLDGAPALPAFLEQMFPEVAELWRGLEDAADLHAGRPAREAHAAASVARSAGRPCRLSVAIHCRDDGDLLPAAVASARSIAEDVEILVVDEGSTDPYTREVLTRLPAAGVEVSTVPARGWAAARNTGFRAASGVCVVAMEGTDRLRPEFVSRALEVLDHEPRTGVVYGDPPRNGRRGPGPVVDLNAGRDDRPNPIDACLLMRREVWRECGGYDEEMAGGYEDWDLLLSAAERGWLFRHLPEPLLQYGTGEPAASDLAHGPFLERLVAKHSVLVDSRLPHRFAEQEARWLAQVERARHLERELVASRAEIERFRSHIEFVEGTRAWKLRAWLLRFRRRLSGVQ